MISEDKLVASLQADSEGFIGDDAAVLPDSQDKRFVITKDLLIENVHFRSDYFTAEDLAQKALHVNLSDVAAMGARPLYILCAIAIPKRLHDYAKIFLGSLASACQQSNIRLIGGDTSASQDALFISVTAVGIALDCNIKYRNGAEVGDCICVVGDMGAAHLGFLSLEQALVGKQAHGIKCFLRPEAKVREGMWLGKQAIVSSMMDISDGLYIDLQRLVSSSKKQAILDMDLLQSHLLPDVSLQFALEGGEDYGLLVTFPKNLLEEFSHKFKRGVGYDLKLIGYITEGEGVSLKRGEQTVDLPVNYFVHFGEES